MVKILGDEFQVVSIVKRNEMYELGDTILIQALKKRIIN